ncbi:hypothetical protein SAMN05414139_10615 [Burkholderia sp. D7]|nr:hypothetical protein SAMN05414139_10615 [Burkholderia sp. D7]
MHNDVAAWQLDIFGNESPIHVVQVKSDPLPDPQYWSESVMDQMVDALISLATDSRRGDNMPESLMDCCSLLSDRLKPKQKKRFEMEEYRATLGWIMGFWDGALPYTYVCKINGVDPDYLQDIIMTNGLLKRDMEQLRHDTFGSLL